MTRIGVLTGGGDCPGLDAVIRAVVRRGLTQGPHSFMGFRNGWLGLLHDDAIELTLDGTSGILTRGGTVLGTSRTDPTSLGSEGLDAIKRTLSRRGIDALVAIGGDGTLRGARDLWREGIPIVGVPKTIDNDVAGTDASVGFQTAVQIATDAIDRLHTTAESHNRVMLVEVMGRNAGWIATCAGMAGGADAILIPERPFDVDAVCEQLHRRHQRGRSFSIIVVAEGARPHTVGDQGGDASHLDGPGSAHPGSIATILQYEIEARTGYETRATILGHLQRGGTPVAYDRILATRFGTAATDAALGGRFGTMTALAGTEVLTIDLEHAVQSAKPLDLRLYDTAAVFFG
jgi:ATP-dependent phosphofructokinase / diphosphate-dependent phosphofructokinase